MILRAITGLCFAVILTGCDDTNTAVAKCRLESIKLTKNIDDSFVLDCLTVAGYQYDSKLCKGGGKAWGMCCQPNSITTKIANWISN
jgi:hypothetical protein